MKSQRLFVKGLKSAFFVRSNVVYWSRSPRHVCEGSSMDDRAYHNCVDYHSSQSLSNLDSDNFDNRHRSVGGGGVGR